LQSSGAVSSLANRSLDKLFGAKAAPFL